MEIRLLKYALEVYKKQSFTKAAHSLLISQPSLSQQIAKLEQDLGVSLFFRGNGPVTPTPEGIRFINKAEKIIKLNEDLEREMREQKEGIGRELTIGTTAITGGHILPPLLHLYRERYPNVTVRLVEESTEKLTDLTVRGLVDISILPLPIEDSHLTTQTILTEPILLALPRVQKEWMDGKLKNLLHDASGEMISGAISLSDLANAPFILLKKGYGFRRTVLEICAENGFQPNVLYETSSIEMAQSLTSYGLGITLVPEMVINHYTGRLSNPPLYMYLDSCPTRTLVFAYHKERYLSLTAQNLINSYLESIYE
ncbi:LysR family transcriptional regulator [Ectobacillus panaciterrae]|uniref:LysR family transcriptional regulator n=1 Tax=Ectobacillus panaciterrae TaxID=363872 RepID=UPI0005505347